MSKIQGNNESETISGTEGNDVIDGGQGFDSLMLPDLDGGVHFELDAENNFVVVSDLGRDTLENVEQVFGLEQSVLINARPAKIKFNFPKPIAEGQKLMLSDGGYVQVAYSNYWGEDFTITLKHFGPQGQWLSSFDLPSDNSQDIMLSRWTPLKNGGYQVEWRDFSGTRTLSYNAQDELITNGGDTGVDHSLTLPSGSTPVTTSLANGYTLQTWVTHNESMGYEIWAQAHNPKGAAIGTTIRINTSKLTEPVVVAVDTESPHFFAVSWTSVQADGTPIIGGSIGAREFEAVGAYGLLDYEEIGFGPVPVKPVKILSGNSLKDKLIFSGHQSIGLFGEDGDDVLQGGSGNDLLDGGAGHDTVLMAGSVAQITFSVDENDKLLISSPQSGTDELRSIEAIQTQLGRISIKRSFNDVGATVLKKASTFNTQPETTLQGDAEQSNVLRMANTHSSVELIGGDRADVIAGGSGSDILTGGAGADRFEFAASGNGVDLISDWGVGDTIAVAGATFTSQSLSQGDGSQVRANQVQWQVNNDVTTLYIGTDNTAGADVVIELNGAATPEQWVLSGETIHWLESLTGQQPATDIQWVSLPGKRSEYTLMHEWEGVSSGRGVEGVWSLRDNVTGAVLSLAGAERIAFADQAVALDMNDEGSLQPALRLLAATLGTDKINDPALMGQYLAQVDAQGEKGAAQLIADIDLLQREAGSNDIADVLSLLYKNVTGHAPDATQLSHLLQMNDEQQLSMADWILLAAHEPLLSGQVAPHINVIELLQNGWSFQTWGDATLGTSGNDTLQAVQGQSTHYDAGDGVDTLQLADTQASYQQAVNEHGQTTLTHALDGSTISLQGVERLQFSDHSLALDMDGNAGQAAALVGLLYGEEGLQNKALVGEVVAYVDDIGLPSLTQLAKANGTLDRITGGKQLGDFILEIQDHKAAIINAQINALQGQINSEELSVSILRFQNMISKQHEVMETLANAMKYYSSTQINMLAAISQDSAVIKSLELSGLNPAGLEYTPWHTA